MTCYLFLKHVQASFRAAPSCVPVPVPLYPTLLAVSRCASVAPLSGCVESATLASATMLLQGGRARISEARTCGPATLKRAQEMAKSGNASTARTRTSKPFRAGQLSSKIRGTPSFGAPRRPRRRREQPGPAEEQRRPPGRQPPQPRWPPQHRGAPRAAAHRGERTSETQRARQSTGVDAPSSVLVQLNARDRLGRRDEVRAETTNHDGGHHLGMARALAAVKSAELRQGTRARTAVRGVRARAMRGKGTCSGTPNSQCKL